MSSTNTQSTLFDQPRPGSNLPEYGVSEISKLLKKTVEDAFGLVRVRGEISECKFHSNGHIYLTLKDEGAVLAAVCWRGQVGRLDLRPEVGMEVVCTGRITTYAGQSKYQMVVEGMTLAGAGALLKLLEDRKKKLAAEGLFDAARKQELPFLPEVIGVVTSPTGAVIRDILHRLEDRFPRRVLVWPVAVQGPGAAEQIAAAIEGFNALHEGGAVPRPDVLIVARGGGSVEDLMPFNEEIVVRAAAASNIALISAVGHETDTTLIDFAADVRAPTPSAAAEMAVPVRAELMAQVADEGVRLWGAVRRMVQDLRERLNLTERALGDPARVIEPLLQRLDERAERLELAWESGFERRKARVAEAAGKLRHPRDVIALATQQVVNLDQRRLGAMRENLLRWKHRFEKPAAALDHLSPKAVLGRGYALVRDAAGHVIASAKDAKKGERVKIEFRDGAKGAVVEE
jgi:exodeoxyribonuclease VII large subunit